MDIIQTGVCKCSPATDLLFIAGRMETPTSSLGEAGRQLEEGEGREGAPKATKTPQQRQQTTI